MTKTWKITLTIVAILIIIASGFWLWLTHEGSTTEIEAVANQFQAPSSWVETDYRIEPPRSVCLGDNPCPSAAKYWSVSHAVSKQELQDALRESGWNFNTKGECDAAEAAAGTGVTICEAEGISGGYSVLLSAFGARNHPDSTNVTLNIRK